MFVRLSSPGMLCGLFGHPWIPPACFLGPVLAYALTDGSCYGITCSIPWCSGNATPFIFHSGVLSFFFFASVSSTMKGILWQVCVFQVTPFYASSIVSRHELKLRHPPPYKQNCLPSWCLCWLSIFEVPPLKLKLLEQSLRNKQITHLLAGGCSSMWCKHRISIKIKIWRALSLGLLSGECLDTCDELVYPTNRLEPGTCCLCIDDPK